MAAHDAHRLMQVFSKNQKEKIKATESQINGLSGLWGWLRKRNLQSRLAYERSEYAKMQSVIAELEIKMQDEAHTCPTCGQRALAHE